MPALLYYHPSRKLSGSGSPCCGSSAADRRTSGTRPCPACLSSPTPCPPPAASSAQPGSQTPPPFASSASSLNPKLSPLPPKTGFAPVPSGRSWKPHQKLSPLSPAQRSAPAGDSRSGLSYRYTPQKALSISPEFSMWVVRWCVVWCVVVCCGVLYVV